MYAQTAGRGRWQAAVLKTGTYKDFAASISFKAVAGVEDKAAGIIFRYRDAGNYYALRANGVEDNLILFKFFDGTRKAIAGCNAGVSPNEWHRIKVQCVGNRIICYFNGEKKLEVEDALYKEGKVGLWTKADSVTYFDDLKIVPIRGP